MSVSGGAGGSIFTAVPAATNLTTLAGAAQAAAQTNGRLVLAPLYWPGGAQIQAIGYQVTVAGEAGSLVTPVIYSDSNGEPVSPLSAATAGSGAGVGVIARSVALSLPAGWYWGGVLVTASPTTPPTLRTGQFTDQGRFGSLQVADLAELSNVTRIQTGLAALPTPFAGTRSNAQPPALYIGT